MFTYVRGDGGPSGTLAETGPVEIPAIAIMMTLSESTVELTPSLAADDTIGKSNDTAILWARLQSLLRRRSIQSGESSIVAQDNEKIENVRARVALAAEAR